MNEERESVILVNESQKIFSVFHKPKNKKNYPVVLFCHGLAGNKVGRYRAYVELSEALVALGIASLRIDFRGCGDSEGRFNAVTLTSEVNDAKVALKYLMKHPDIDTSRIAIYGRSMGSLIAILTACEFPQVKTLCLWAPVFHGQDWVDQWKKAQKLHTSSREFKELLSVEGQTPGNEFFKEFFSITMDKKMPLLQSVPLLLIHGSKDKMVPLEHSRQYLKFREGADAETKFIELPNCDHHFTDITERELAMKETCQWFKQTI